MKTALAAFALALAVPALAQSYADFPDYDFDTARAMAESARAASAAARARSAALDNALVAMNDGVGAGMVVVDLLKEKDVTVAFAAQAEASKTVVASGKTTILLSDKLPALPRVIAPLIAKEAAVLMFAGMPACAERSYMRRATVARVWVELGGDPKRLPVIEPLDQSSVPELVAEISPWAKDAQTALDMVSRIEGLAVIPDLEGLVRSDAERAALEAANSRFVKFLLDERPVRQDAGLR